MVTSGKLKYISVICCIVTQENTTQLSALCKRKKGLFTFQIIVKYVIPSERMLSGDRAFETLKQKRRYLNFVAILFATLHTMYIVKDTYCRWQCLPKTVCHYGAVQRYLCFGRYYCLGPLVTSHLCVAASLNLPKYIQDLFKLWRLCSVKL